MRTNHGGVLRRSDYSGCPAASENAESLFVSVHVFENEFAAFVLMFHDEVVERKGASDYFGDGAGLSLCFEVGQLFPNPRRDVEAQPYAVDFLCVSHLVSVPDERSKTLCIQG